jgi:predicted CxxxxCH...CXXCH cytochrome family protein
VVVALSTCLSSCTCGGTTAGRDAAIDASGDGDSDGDGEQTCFSCHGDEETPAPPPSLDGDTSTGARGVGAHRSHMTVGATWHRDVQCEDCHVVPDAPGDAGHNDTDPPADMTFSDLARTDGARPEFDGTICASVYCHGGTLDAGGRIAGPTWTVVDGSQVECGSCHATPPTEPHPQREDCTSCHPTVDEDQAFVEPGRHIDGTVDVDELSCQSCHGTGDEAAPPVDTSGNRLTTARGVGAHRSHVDTSDWHVQLECADCHAVPEEYEDEGHMDTSRPAELEFGALAVAEHAHPSFDGTACSEVYCHGATLLPGGENTEPEWTSVGTGEANCGACHGIPPDPPHPIASDCSPCHPTIGDSATIAVPERHVDGTVDFDFVEEICSSCHGSGTEPAPPVDTSGNDDTSVRGVGAHRSHLGPSEWRAEIGCEECHIVPETLFSPGHYDTPLPAELMFGPLASADGAEPGFDGESCTSTYCHGSTLSAGGTSTEPSWMRVDGTEAACGTCHGLPPAPPHPNVSTCSTCHETMDAEGGFVAPERHVDGLVDASSMACTSCHGTDPDPAPPVDTERHGETTYRGVGAHQSHLAASDWRATIACEECHHVPVTVEDPGHLDTELPAELTFGAIAGADGAAPIFDGERCSSTYCHGATLLAGGTSTEPSWMRVDGTEAACGTCHGLPPAAPHPPNARCGSCHSNIDMERHFTAPERHVDGVVDLAGMTCTSCHGSGDQPAPPVDTVGNDDTSARGVGAHRSHLRTSDWRAAISCDVCHQVPAELGDVDHLDSDLPAELSFRGVAAGGGGRPSFDGARCASVYCHGATLDAGGTNTEPTWTTVDGTETECGTCHALPPEPPHPTNPGCASCHPVLDAARRFTAPERHVDGVVDLAGMTCTSCHGSDDQPAPPLDTLGRDDTGLMSVGAHRSHLGASDWHAEVVCSDCHAVPDEIGDAGHMDSALPAELDFGELASSRGAVPELVGETCTGVYCHGASLHGRGGTNTEPEWTTVDGTEAACGTCHAIPPHFPAPSCGGCHPSMAAAGREFIDPDLHVNGLLEAEGGCLICHEVPQDNGDGVPVGGRRAVVGEFSATSHHVRTEVEESDCVVCHDVSEHQGGHVRLLDPDDRRTVYDFDAITDGELEPFCVHCHDGDGALAGDGRTPFSDGVTVPDVAGGPATGWERAAHNQFGYELNDDEPISCFGDGVSTGCHGGGHGSASERLLAADAGTPISRFCQRCHTEGHIVNEALSGAALADDIEQSFTLASRHPLGRAFTVNEGRFELQCTTCHNPHVVTGAFADGVDGLTPVTRPDFSVAPATNPRAMGTRLWGDDESESMDWFAGTGTYRTPNGDLLAGDEIPDYVTFCLDCHAVRTELFGHHGGMGWGGDEPHGLNSANSPNGGGTCPNWFACGKAEGWDNDDCLSDDETCWPPMPRGRGDQLFSRSPYSHEERIGGANFVLSCTDCHEAHGAAVQSLVRSDPNNGTGTWVWNTMCNNCHYYYSDWHAGMSCGNASCHFSGRMGSTGTSTIHAMSNRIGSGAVRTFDPDLVADLRFEGNLNDSGSWRMHAGWKVGAGSFVAGRHGQAVQVSNSPFEVGTTNAYWSTDAGRHGTWVYTESRYHLTLEAWVYPTDDTRDSRTIIAKHTYWDGGYVLLLRRVGGTWRAAFQTNVTGGGPRWGDGGWDSADCNGLRGAFSSVSVPLNQWTHIAATYDFGGPDRDPADRSVGRIRIYVNGEDVTWSNSGERTCYSQPSPGEDAMFPYSDHSPENEAICYDRHWCASALSVGGLNWSDANANFIGRLDDVRIWNITLEVEDFETVDRESVPRINQVRGAADDDTLTVTFTEGVYANRDATGALAASDFVLTDLDDGRRIVGVTHVAGDRVATIELSSPLDGSGDIAVDTLAAAANAIFDEFANAAGTGPVVVSN